MATSTVGDKEASKKAQKKAKKKKISLKIKKRNPTRNDDSNLWVWYPINLSCCTSFHQRNEIRTTNLKLITKKLLNFEDINNTIFSIIDNNLKEIKKGHKEVWTGRKGPKTNIL